MHRRRTHSRNQHVVIARPHRLLNLTLHIRQRCIQQRNSSMPLVPVHPLKPVLPTHRKTVRKVALLRAQKTQTESASRMEQLQDG